MAEIIGEIELRKFINENNIIQNGDIDCAEGIKYDFRLGTRFLKAGFNSPKSYDELNARDAAIVEPGEVVFVLTNERVEIPLDISVQLHEKRKLSHDGINLLGGRGIDPGYKGYLVFGIHNVAGSIFRLHPGRKLVGATFYRLKENEIVTPDKLPESLEDFPEKLLDLIEKYKPVNPTTISTKLSEIQGKINEDKGELLKRVDDIDSKISEVDNRTKKIDESILDTKAMIKAWAKIIAWIFAIAGAVIAAIVAAHYIGLFERIFG